MAQKYRIALSDGRQFDVESEGGPPSEADVLASLGGDTGPAMPFSRRGGMTDPAMQTPEVFRTSNEVDAQGNPVVRAEEPNTAGTFVGHVGQQINPLPLVTGLATATGQSLRHPIDTLQGEAGLGAMVKGIGAAQGALFDKAKASYDAGDYVTSARHFVNYLLPLVGPALDKSADEMQQGHYAAGIGDAVGIGLGLFGPQKATELAAARYPLAANPMPPTPAPTTTTPPTPRQSAVAAGQAAGVPVDLPTVTGNDFLRGTQKLAGKSLGGSVVAQRAGAATGEAMEQWGARLANEAREGAVTPEQAGTGVREALTSKQAAHTALADRTYEQLRALEALPENQMDVALPKNAPVDKLAADQGHLVSQLRRIVHEMDASGYVGRTWNYLEHQQGKRGNAGGGDYEMVPGSAGAKVYDDIKARLTPGSSVTRGDVQDALEAYLAGGKETPTVTAALRVARDRFKGSNEVSAPELPADAMQIPTRLEAKRVTSETMGLPVNLTQAKKVLQPLYDNMKRQMPVAQQQQSASLKAIENVLDSKDFGPLSQIDQDLSAIKALARKQGGLAKEAVRVLDTAVREAAANGGPRVSQMLEQGRGAVKAGVVTEDLIDALPGGTFEEGRAVFKAATAPEDAGIQMLRTLRTETPTALPPLARAKLSELLSSGPDKAAGEWVKLGPETKALLFPETGQIQRLDDFFHLGKLLAENPNRSGSAFTGWQGVELGMLFSNPVVGIPYSIGQTALSHVLQSPATVEALNKMMAISLKPTTPLSAQTAAAANLLRLAQQHGVPLEAAAGRTRSAPPAAPETRGQSR